MTTQSLDLNLIPKGISPRLYVSQYDKGQTWTFNIYAGNTAYTIPNGATVTIQGTKPDKTGFQYSCTASGNVVTATEQQQMTVIAGEVPAEIRITNNNEIIATLNFILVVEPAALTDETEISETDLPIIEQAIEMFPHYQEMIDEVSSDIQTLSNVRAELGAHNFGLRYIDGTNDVGLTLKNAPDGGTYVNGTATAGGGRTRLKSEPFLLKAGQYAVVGDSSDHTKYSNVVLQNATNGAVIATYEISNGSFVGSGNVFTLAADTMCYFGFNTANGTAYGTDTFIIYPMVKLADDKDDTFYPYSKPNTELTKDTKGLTDNQFENGAVNLVETQTINTVINGLTIITNADKSITINGTSTASVMIQLQKGGDSVRLFRDGKLQTGKRYKLSGCPQSSLGSNVKLVLNYVSNDSAVDYSDIGDGVIADIPYGVSGGNYIIVVEQNVTVTNLTFKPMITVADMPNSDYAHYVPYAKSNKELTEKLKDKEITITSSNANVSITNGKLIRKGNSLVLNIEKITLSALSANSYATIMTVTDSEMIPSQPVYAFVKILNNTSSDLLVRVGADGSVTLFANGAISAVTDSYCKVVGIVGLI